MTVVGSPVGDIVRTSSVMFVVVTFGRHIDLRSLAADLDNRRGFSYLQRNIHHWAGDPLQLHSRFDRREPRRCHRDRCKLPGGRLANR